MLKNFAKAVPLSVCLFLMVTLFSFLLPVIVLCILDQNDGSMWSIDARTTRYIWVLWSPELKAQVYQWSFKWMVFVGFFVGVDAALRIKWRILRIDRQKTRIAFFTFHAAVAFAIVVFDFCGLFLVNGAWFSVRQFDYVLLVQSIPMFWFIYSWVTLRQSFQVRQRVARTRKLQGAAYRKDSGTGRRR